MNRWLRAVAIAILLMSAVHSGEAGGEIAGLVQNLSGPNALAEFQASRALVAKGDEAVPALARLAGSPGRLAPRLVAVELIGEIGTDAAREALLGLLTTERKNLAVRGQVCVQLGYLRERKAVPLIAEWLRGIGPRSLHDVRGPKEVQPSTCYIRHIEALAMIGDEAGLAILEEFKQKIPQNVGWHGFLTNFVTGAVTSSLEDLKDKAEFWKAVREHPGLEQKIAPLFDYLHANRVAKFRLHESEIVRGTEQGQTILRELAKHSDPRVAAAAKAAMGVRPERSP